MYILQNSAVALSAVTALVGLNLEPKSSAFWAAAFFTIGFGSASSVGAQGSALSVEKEWSTTLCYGDSAAMAKLNSGNAHRSVRYAMTTQACSVHVHVIDNALMPVLSLSAHVLSVGRQN